MRIRWTRWNTHGSRYLSQASGIDFFFIRCIYFKSPRDPLTIGFKTRNRSAFNAKYGSRRRNTQPRSLPFFPHFLARFIARVYSLKHLRVTHIRTYACIHRHRPVVTRFPSRQFILGFRLFVFFYFAFPHFFPVFSFYFLSFRFLLLISNSRL